MKSVVFERGGGVEELKMVEGFTPRERSRGLVRVRVLAAALNPVDWKVRLSLSALVKLPKVCGADLVGIVEEADEDCDFKPGDRVFGMHHTFSQDGSLTESTVIEASYLSHAPENLSDEECAALPLVACTVVQTLGKGGLSPQHPVAPGKSILIHAGAGGVGSFAIPYAKLCGLKVYTTCSEGKMELVSRLGADVAIDYKKEEFERVAEEMDYVLDVIGGTYELRSLKCLKKNGTYFNVLNSGWANTIGGGQSVPDGVTGAGSHLGGAFAWLNIGYRKVMQYLTGPKYVLGIVHPSGETLAIVKELCEKHGLAPVIDSVFVLDEFQNAFRKLETGKSAGKIVIRVQ